MSFLPIIERELLVSSRRKATFRVRWWTTLIGTGATLICLVVVSTKPLPAGVTNPLFAVLAICAFILSFLAGAFLTSDSISEERRGGTLGFLFLSNLTSHDIILGKFCALFLNAFFSVLALLPVMGVPLLLGGLELSEFSRVVLALLNMLFFSLAAGIFISAFGGSQASVVTRTLMLLLLIVAGLPLFGELFPSAFWASGRAGMGWASPFYPFAYAFEIIHNRQPSKFWGTLFTSHLLGWLFLGLATRALSRRWQDSGTGALAGNETNKLHSRWGLETNGGDSQRRDSADNAVGLLLGRAPVTRGILWGALGIWSLVLAINWGGANQADLTYAGAKMFALLLKMLAAIQACKFFSESQSTGVLELLLCTPLRNSDIISAQWRKLRRVFLWPAITLMIAALASFTFPGKPIVTRLGPWNAWIGEPGFIGVCWLALRLGADFLAVGWLGMCLGLTLKKPILAPILTILLVLVLPAPFSWLDLIADMLFISWGTTRLQKDFRDVLIQRYQESTSPVSFGQTLSPAT